MKSFLLPVGRTAGASLSTMFAAMSCGVTLPVTDLDIIHLSDQETDPVLQPLIHDLDQAHEILLHPDNHSLFPSSFIFHALRPQLPGIRSLSDNPSSFALLGALRGKGIPLSYKTDREAVEWVFSAILSDSEDVSLSELHSWIGRIRGELDSGEEVRAAVLCDLCDPFSAGIAFAVLRYLHETAGLPSRSLALFCLCIRDSTSPDASAETLASSLRALSGRMLIGRPDRSMNVCADAAWLLALPSALVRSSESLRVLYAAAARQLAVFFSSGKLPGPGLHTINMSGILTFQSLGDHAVDFASFLHVSAWLLSDLIPALSVFLDHPGSFRSISPNTRNGLFRRLFSGKSSVKGAQETLPVLHRALCAVLSEVLSLIRFLPGQLRLAEVSDSRWQDVVDACGRTVTVASEYDVSMAEAREGGILDVRPVHRVSLADTEEEKLEHRLTDIQAQLKNEEEARSRLFDAVGSCWAVLSLLDCRSRCTDALNRAKDRQNSGCASTDISNLSSAALSRRIRLLEAAVSRCDEDLSVFRRRAFTEISIPSAPVETPSPFAGELLGTEAAEKLASLLTASGDEAETMQKEFLSMFPGLLYGFTLSDARSLLRRLISVCGTETSPDPLRSLFLSALCVSHDETVSLRFISSGRVPSIPLLPDLYPEGHLLTVDALLALLPQSDKRSADSDVTKRGLLAMLLLRQYRRRTSDESALSFDQYVSGDSPVLHAWLSFQGSDQVWIVSLGADDHLLPFALILPGLNLIPARFTSAHRALLPGFAVPWFDEDTFSFRDPCRLVSEGDRSVLLDILGHMISSGGRDTDSGLISFLESFRRDLLRSQENLPVPDHLELRLKAAFGLRLLPAFGQALVRITCPYERFLTSDNVAMYLMGRSSLEPSSCAVRDDVIYLYRDVPFARENSRTLLEAIPLPAENWILSLLDQECRVLSRSSDDYHDALVNELNRLLVRCPDTLPEARQTALSLLEEARRPVNDSDTELVWPWDPASPSVRTILSECLGEQLASMALHPFSDMLTLFPARGNEAIGDALMSSMCLLPSVPVSDPEIAPSVLPDAVLPPLSAELCAALCRLPEGKTLLRPGLLSFDRKDNQSVRVTITFEGAFVVRLIRDYAEEDILHLYSHDIPTLAVWPDLPFPPEDWSAYFIYLGLPSALRVTADTADGERLAPDGNEKRSVCRSASFPLSFSFSQDGRSIGSLPNLLPSPVVERKEPFTACVDFGSVGTSVIFSVGHRRHPMQGPTMVRTLINNPAVSRDLLRREFLPAVPVSALLPTASRIFRNVPGARPLPFEDGIVLMTSNLQDVMSIPAGSLYTCLKWEEDKGRSVTICLHQIMLMTALQARSEGATSLAWRFSLPDDMAKTGRERLTGLFSSLAELVSQESGFSIPEKTPRVTFAPESSALGAYFRLCASEDTRGGFMVMDIGACTADISLFLRGREQAVSTCQVPLGVHYMLLPSLLRNPGLLRQDLGYIQDPSFCQDLLLLEQITGSARADSSALRHLRLALDSFIADRFSLLIPGLLQNPLTGMPTRIGSVLLLHLSYLMMMAGLVLLQIASDPGKNDFLPEQLSLCLSGRGSLLPENLPDPYKSALWRFLTMFRNHRVASLSFLFSSEKKMEIPVGLSVLQEVSADLPPDSDTPSAIPVRPEELLPRFILQFAKEFPASAEILFHGFFTGDYYHPFTSYGESIITEAISRSFTEQTSRRPFDALSAWIGSLLQLIGDSAV